MYVLIASFIDQKENKLIGLRFIDIDSDENNKESFDLTIEDTLADLADGSISICGVTNEDELYQLSYLASQFDIESGCLINDFRYIKLDDTTYADCLGKIYYANNPVELDNILAGRVLTEMDKEEDKSELEEENISVKEINQDDLSFYTKACGLGNYSKIALLTDKYLSKIDYGVSVEDELLKIRRAGRFLYSLPSKKIGCMNVCANRETGLYGICCISSEGEWVVLEPVYSQLETVRINTTTYIMGLKDNIWYLIDLKKKDSNILLSDIQDWFAINNADKKSGRLFIALDGNKDSGYYWYLVDKGGIKGRQIGCKMLLTDVLFAKGRSYAKLVDTVEFGDPRHGDTVIVSMKDYSMDSMLSFRRTIGQLSIPNNTNEEVVLYYNITCDATSGEIVYETDKGYKSVIRTFIEVNPDFISYLSLFYGLTPKDYSIDVKVRKHYEKRHQYTFMKVDVEVAEKVKELLTYFMNYTSAKVLSAYWNSLDMINLDVALNDLELSNFSHVCDCNDGIPLYVKILVIKNIDESSNFILLSRRKSKNIQVNTYELVQSGGYISDSLSSGVGLENILKLDVGYYPVKTNVVSQIKQEHNIKGIAPLDIVQKYKKTKFTIKHTTYRNVNTMKLVCSINRKTEEILEFSIMLKSYDGLDFKTSDVVMKKLEVDGHRDIEDVREHAKAYAKLMNESQPVLSGFYQSAFLLDVI